MRSYHTWLLDLDDTLQVGPSSWAELHIFPDIIKQTGIKPERAAFEAAYNRAEEMYNAGGSNEVLGDEFFQMVGWPLSMKTGIIERFTNEYKPVLYEETPAFLEWVMARGNHLYMTSNNKWARSVCQMMGIDHYFTDILTPAACGVSDKPSPGMWEYLKTHAALGGESGIVVVGDSLVSDGLFASNCGLDCIIVDRYDRVANVPERCFRATSLADIIAQIDQIGS
jgi:FMN phosphatase YigB (HAD superfamily)